MGEIAEGGEIRLVLLQVAEELQADLADRCGTHFRRALRGNHRGEADRAERHAAPGQAAEEGPAWQAAGKRMREPPT